MSSSTYLYVAFFRVWPPYSGASAVTWGSVSHTRGTRLLLQAGGEEQRETVDGVDVVNVGGGRGRWGRLLRLPLTLRRMVAEVRRHAPDVVVLEGASWVLYSWRLARRLRRARFDGRVVYHAHNVEYLLRRARSGRLVSALTRWVEGRLLRSVDACYAVSDDEARAFERLYGVRPKLWPNGVDTARFDGVTSEDVEAARRRHDLPAEVVLFTGSYRYPPNQEAIDLLVRDVFPRVRRRRPEAVLAVLGGPVPYDEGWLVNPGKLEHAEFPAFVRACQVGVAPVLSGAGTRVKILEYMAAGLPVVATAKGAEGLGLTPGEHYREGDDVDAVSNHVADLLDAPEAARRVAERGREAVRRRFAWPAVMEGVARSVEEPRA